MKRHNGPEQPPLEPGEHLVLLAEVATGIILELDGKRRLKGSTNDWIVVFDNIAEAREFARQQVERTPEIECWIQPGEATDGERVVAESALQPHAQPKSRKNFRSRVRHLFSRVRCMFSRSRSPDG